MITRETTISGDFCVRFIKSLDRYQLKDRMSEFPIIGVFEVKDGVIQQWRDYFDMQQCLEQLPENIELPI